MGVEDMERQSLNVFRMQLLGATVRPVDAGSRTLKDAINEAMRDWVANVTDSYYLLGSVLGGLWRDNDVAPVLATAVVALSVLPLRDRLQKVAERITASGRSADELATAVAVLADVLTPAPHS